MGAEYKIMIYIVIIYFSKIPTFLRDNKKILNRPGVHIFGVRRPLG
jgi:hypothetical protein